MRKNKNETFFVIKDLRISMILCLREGQSWTDWMTVRMKSGGMGDMSSMRWRATARTSCVISCLCANISLVARIDSSCVNEDVCA